MTFEAWSTESASAALEAYASDEHMVLVALQELQTRFGYVHPDAIALVATTCNVSRADVHGVLSFYHELRTTPPAEHTIRICRGEACQAVGSRAVESAFAEVGHPVGSHSERVSVEAVYCMGNCALGPNVEVNGELRGRFSASSAAEVL